MGDCQADLGKAKYLGRQGEYTQRRANSAGIYSLIGPGGNLRAGQKDKLEIRVLFGVTSETIKAVLFGTCL